MDFTYLLEIAKMNDTKNKKDDAKFFPSKLSKAKKVDRPAPNSEAVKALLEQKEKDRQKKQTDFIKERKKLEERRSLDKKNNRKILAMINRTKGASKSVLDEAKDLIVVNGEEQCDVDDYGYESELSQQIFSKLTTEYRETPETDRLLFKKTAKTDIKDIKNRVINSLKIQHEEDTGVRKRTRKRKTEKKKEGDDFINDGDPYNNKAAKGVPIKRSVSPEPTPVIKKFKKPMPPPMSFKDLISVAKKKQHEPLPVAPKAEDLSKGPEARPLTAKEKEEKETERLRRLRRMWKLPDKPSEETSKPRSEEGSSATRGEVPKKATNAKPTGIDTKKEQKMPDRSKYFAMPNSAPVSAQRRETIAKIRDPPRHPALMKKPAKPPVPPTRPACEDEDEDDYDSEMDDFIDDGDTEMDVSSEIGKIFGYDKSKYRLIDEEDDSAMEASYSQLQKEEKMSAKIGFKEDQEELRREELHQKTKNIRKMELNKAHKRKRIT